MRISMSGRFWKKKIGVDTVQKIGRIWFFVQSSKKENRKLSGKAAKFKKKISVEISAYGYWITDPFTVG